MSCEETDMRGGEITDCAFDPKGTRLACVLGDQTILILTGTSTHENISEWEKSIINGPNHTTFLLIEWDVMIY